MTDQNAEPTVTAPSELETLKARAVTLGINHHSSIGVDKLRERINNFISDKPVAPEPQEAVSTNSTLKKETTLERDSRLRRESNKLTRVIVTCRNPQKAEWEGEVFTAGNSVIGTVKKYIPFNNENGWHVPEILLNMMRERKVQIFVNKTENGRTQKVSKEIPEFSIEVLPPLTPNELAELGRKQEMQRSVEAQNA